MLFSHLFVFTSAPPSRALGLLAVRRALAILMSALFLAGCATPSVRNVSFALSADSSQSTTDTDMDTYTDADADTDAPRQGAGMLAPASDVSGTRWAALSAVPNRASNGRTALDWEVFRAPGKQATRYRYVQHEGRDAVLATGDATSSILRHQCRIESANLGHIHFSWNVPGTASNTNVSLLKLDDVPVRVVLAFEGDRTRFSMKNTLLSELSELLIGEPLPYATLIYSWSRVSPIEQIIPNDQSDRIRKLVVQSGDGGRNQWHGYERDIRADFKRAFGEEPGALTSFAVFTEGDKNHGSLQAWYGPVVFKPAP